MEPDTMPVCNLRYDPPLPVAYGDKKKDRPGMDSDLTPLPTYLLFQPFHLKSLELKNRFVMAPMTRQFSPDGVPTADVVSYYRRRAEGEVARADGAGRAENHRAVADAGVAGVRVARQRNRQGVRAELGQTGRAAVAAGALKGVTFRRVADHDAGRADGDSKRSRAPAARGRIAGADGVQVAPGHLRQPRSGSGRDRFRRSRPLSCAPGSVQ